ncbi:hypothetical protein Hdeb2414_s1235g00994631 [Helianthus debilis subsp. tardiflorus]
MLVIIIYVCDDYTNSCVAFIYAYYQNNYKTLFCNFLLKKSFFNIVKLYPC